jgi:hypothetical protein
LICFSFFVTPELKPPTSKHKVPYTHQLASASPKLKTSNLKLPNMQIIKSLALALSLAGIATALPTAGDKV